MNRVIKTLRGKKLDWNVIPDLLDGSLQRLSLGAKDISSGLALLCS